MVHGGASSGVEIDKARYRVSAELRELGDEYIFNFGKSQGTPSSIQLRLYLFEAVDFEHVLLAFAVILYTPALCL